MKKLINFLMIILAIIVISVFYKCNNSTKNVVAHVEFKSPFKDVSVNPDSTVIDPQKKAEIKTKKGSKFSIPENAFVFDDGSIVKEPVNVKIREFNNSAEILISGIPMKCDSAGQEFNFESAGMFEINGNCNGKEVFLATGKSIDVNLVSTDNGNYDFYLLNEESGKWEKKINAASLPKKQNLATDSIAKVDNAKIDKKDMPLKLVEPKKIDKSKSILDFDVNLKNFPEINVYNGVVWQYSDNKKYLDPDKNKAIFSTTWENFELKPLDDSTEYLLTLSSQNKSFTTSVVPVLNEKNFKKALKIFKKNMAEYNQQMAQLQEEVNRQTKENFVLRTFAINEMGIYNWDRLYKEPQVLAVNADFKFDKLALNNFNDITIFFITDNGRTVVTLPKSTWGRFAFNPEKENKILAVLPANKIAYFSSSDFKSLNTDNLKNTGSYTFVLKVAEKKIVSSENLNDILLSI
ncbi:MAG: hypothetical protein HXX09_11800 [Bacteroidetes bacterium]|nr:hypothetical protein [Bacteroidota bacterium]